MDDLVDGKGGSRTAGVLGVVIGQGFGDFGKPFVELRLRAGVQRREGADHAGLALRDRQLGMRDDEQRCADDRQSRRSGKNWRKRHRFLHPSVRRAKFLTFA
ncbi:hypothetical protein D3C87_1825520 [compost metagenome]